MRGFWLGHFFFESISSVGEWIWGAPITPETQPPLAHQFSKVKEIDLFTTSLFLKRVWGQKQILGDHNKQTISWSFEYSLPRSQSKAGWFRCFCLGLQSTTECSGAFGLKCNKKSLSLSSMKAKLEQFQNSRLMQILAWHSRGKKTLDPGGLHPGQEENDLLSHRITSKKSDTRWLCHTNTQVTWVKTTAGVVLPKAAVVQFEDSLGEDKKLVVDHRS